MTEEPEPLGTLTVTVGKVRDVQTVTRLRVGSLAADKTGHIYLLGVVAHLDTIKGLRACLNADVTAFFELKGVAVTDGIETHRARGLQRLDAGYSVHVAHLGHGQHHALFQTRDPSFLNVVSDESLFRALKGETYTTPILRSWIPYVRQRLEALGLLAPLWCLDCRCARLTATTADLDAIVSDGAKHDILKFREDHAA